MTDARRTPMKGHALPARCVRPIWILVTCAVLYALEDLARSKGNEAFVTKVRHRNRTDRAGRRDFSESLSY